MDAVELGPITNAGRIADLLRKEIIERRIGAGHRMTVATLSSRFGVSGAPVREALQQLGAEGFLTLLPNRGAVARAFGPTELAQVFAIREALEGFQAARFAKVATRGQVERMRGLATEFAELIEGGTTQRSAEVNRELHRIVNAHDDNRELLLVLERHQGVARMMRYDFGQSPERSAAAATEHFTLVDAIDAGDESRARAVAAAHVAGTLADILACYAAQKERQAAGQG